MQVTSKISGRAALQSSRLLGGRSVDDGVVELYAGLKAGLRGRRIGCGAPQRHLGRELRFNSESEILLNTSESSLGILTLVSYVQRDLYATVPGKTFVGGAQASRGPGKRLHNIILQSTTLFLCNLKYLLLAYF